MPSIDMPEFNMPSIDLPEIRKTGNDPKKERIRP
jgi:hypothetical protein